MRLAFTLLLACGLVVTVAAQDPVQAVHAKLDQIKAEAQAVLNRNATLSRKSKLPLWVTDAQKRIITLANEAQGIVFIRPSGVGEPGGAGGAGPTYYVRENGNDSCDGTANVDGTSGTCAWKTIDKCLDTVSAGDTCRIQAGTYVERITPGVSGTSSDPITLVADGAVTFCGGTFATDSYIRVIGFTIDSDGAGCSSVTRAIVIDGTCTGLEFWNNTIRDEDNAIAHNSFDDRAHQSLFIGNLFTGTQSISIALRGDDNIFGYNTFDLLMDAHSPIGGASSRWLNNFSNSSTGGPSAHSDVWQYTSNESGLQDNLFESNISLGNGTYADEHVTLVRNVAACTGACGSINENLWRHNVWHNGNGGHGFSTPTQGAIANNRIVHETNVEMRRFSTSVVNTYSFTDTDVNGYVHNTLFWEGWGTAVSSGINPYLASAGAVITSADYNLAFDPDGSVTFAAAWTDQANEVSNSDPLMADVDGDDFTLGSGSAAIGAAGPLTTTSGSGTGTTFNVVSGGGGFFRGANTDIAQYGGALAPGDVITVGTDTVTVASISTDAITVTASFTWADGESVYLGNDTTPDIGAYPYKAGGYTLTATYAEAGGTVTITPNDASLVRWVVCYSDNVPYAVDNASPYTCARAAGTFSAYAYKRYASTVGRVLVTP